MWKKKPKARPGSVLTVEKQTEFRDSTSTSCIDWTPNYLWSPNELACAENGQMYSCKAVAYCGYVDPNNPDLLAKADTKNGGPVWTLVGAAVEKEDFAKGEDCISY